MAIAASILISITALIHILFFKLESIDFMKPGVLKKFGLDSHSGELIKPWAFNQGFYNLFFAIGLILSLYLIHSGKKEAGVWLASFILLSISGAGVVLYLSTPDKLTASLIQGPPAILAFTLLRLS